jgi:replicative DNA helicase
MSKHKDHKQTEALMPHFTPAEKAVIAACILDNDTIPAILSQLKPDDFYHHAHRLSFMAISDLYPFQEVDFVTISNWLKDKHHFEEVGGGAFIGGLMDDHLVVDNYAHYVKIVKDKSRLRQLNRVCLEAISETANGASIASIVSNIQKGTFEALVLGDQGGPRHIKELCQEFSNKLKEDANQRRSPGIRCGFNHIDHLTGGFRPGDLIVLAARPSMGKSALAVDISRRVSETDPVVVFTLEMGNRDVWERLVSMKSRVPFMRIRQSALNEDDLLNIELSNKRLYSQQLWLDDAPALTPTEIMCRAQNLALSESITWGLVIVDYLQIVKPDKESTSRERDVASISSAMKMMAKTLNCPVLLLSQLNRDVTKRKINEQRPQLSDLRESGAIEQDADVVIGLWRKHPITHEEDHKNHAEIGIMKHRNGPIGWGDDYAWNPSTATFVDNSEQSDSDRYYNPPSYHEPRENDDLSQF